MIFTLHTEIIRDVIKKFSARNALVRYIELKSMSVGHLILLNDIGIVKSILT